MQKVFSKFFLRVNKFYIRESSRLLEIRIKEHHNYIWDNFYIRPFYTKRKKSRHKIKELGLIQDSYKTLAEKR